MPVTTGTTTGTSASSGGGSKSGGGQGGSSGSNPGLTKGYVGPAGTNRGAWSGDGQYLGLTTGPTIYGNTAFGPAGGMATGYATRDMQSLAQAGMGPTPGMYGNFMTPGGSPMFGGSPVQGQSFQGMNAQQARAQALAAFRAWLASQRPAGLLGDPAAPRPNVPRTYVPQVPPIMPEVFAPVPPEVVPGYQTGLSYQYNMQHVPGYGYANYFKNPTDNPQFSGSGLNYRTMSSPNGPVFNNNGAYAGSQFSPANPSGQTMKDQSRVPQSEGFGQSNSWRGN